MLYHLPGLYRKALLPVEGCPEIRREGADKSLPRVPCYFESVILYFFVRVVFMILQSALPTRRSHSATNATKKRPLKFVLKVVPPHSQYDTSKSRSHFPLRHVSHFSPFPPLAVFTCCIAHPQIPHPTVLHPHLKTGDWDLLHVAPPPRTLADVAGYIELFLSGSATPEGAPFCRGGDLDAYRIF